MSARSLEFVTAMIFMNNAAHVVLVRQGLDRAADDAFTWRKLGPRLVSVSPGTLTYPRSDR